jgi:hypothetical protein
VLDPFAFGPASVIAGTNIASFVRVWRRDRRTDANTDGPALEEALAAQLSFQGAAVAVLHRLTYLSDLGLPPTFHGAAWSWPAAYRICRDFPHGVEALHVAFAKAMTIGPVEVQETTIEVFAGVGLACSAFVARGRTGKKNFDAHVEATYNRLGSHVTSIKTLVPKSTP